MQFRTIQRACLICSVTAIAFFAEANQRPAQAATSEDVANFLLSRYWWDDHGTFWDRASGFVYLFAPTEQAPGWYRGERVRFLNNFQNNRLGIAWYPFVQDGLVGVVVDAAYNREVYVFTGFNPQTETLSWVAFVGNQQRTGTWTSTRSPLTPSSVRRHYWK